MDPVQDMSGFLQYLENEECVVKKNTERLKYVDEHDLPYKVMSLFLRTSLMEKRRVFMQEEENVTIIPVDLQVLEQMKSLDTSDNSNQGSAIVEMHNSKTSVDQSCQVSMLT